MMGNIVVGNDVTEGVGMGASNFVVLIYTEVYFRYFWFHVCMYNNDPSKMQQCRSSGTCRPE